MPQSNKDEVVVSFWVSKKFDKKIADYLKKVNVDPDRVRKLFKREFCITAIDEYIKNHSEGE